MKHRVVGSVIGVLAGLCLFAGSAAAQGGELVSAEYGIHNHRADVTQQVRSWIHDGVLQFDVDGRNLGVDPAKGHVKELFIRLRHWDGSVEEFHYPEYAHVNLVLDPERGSERGYERHERGFHILRAYYGGAGHFVDVTETLRNMKRDERLFVVVDNRSMGGDPDPDVHKVLRVLYSQEGERRNIVVPEHGELRLP